MLRAPLALLTTLGLLLAGCAEQGAPPATDDPAYVAFLDAPDERGPNRTILALRADGSADRLTYFADGSWTARVAPGLDVDERALRPLFEGDALGERGGMLVRLERGRVDEDARRAVEARLEEPWPAPFLPPGEPHPWYRPVVMGRVDPAAWTQAPPDAEQHAPEELAAVVALLAAFQRTAETFEADETREADLPYDQAWDGCLRASTRVATPVVSVGEPVEVEAEVTNCGAADVTLDPARCAMPPQANVQLMAHGRAFLAALPPSAAPAAAYALDLECRGDEDPVTIAPGEAVVLTRRWNGTLASCRAATDCSFRPAPAGEYGVVTWASGQDTATPATIRLVDPAAPTPRLLVVREFDYANTTAEGYIMADFGPHCAPVSYTREPPSVAVRHGETRPAIGGGLVVRDWRESDRPPRAMTVSADRLDVDLMEDGVATLRSPFDRDLVLAEVRLDGEGFLVDGEPLAPGAAKTLRIEREIESEGGVFQTTSILVFEDLGPAPLLWERMGACM